jgi:tetratricopeptide (TPR) repeat protein
MTFAPAPLLQHRLMAVAVCFSLLSGATLVFSAPQAYSAPLRLRGTVSAAVRQANQYFQIGKYDQAEKAFTQAVKRNPKDAYARAGLSLVQAELFKLGAAEKNAQEAIRLNPKNPYAHIALGTALRNRTASSDMTYRNQREKLLSQAIEQYKKAISLDPSNPDAYNRLGEVYRSQGKFDEAMESFQKATQHDAKYSEALANMGTIMKAKGDIDGAIGQYNQAIEINSKNHLAHFYKGDALVDKGDYHEALKSFNTALYLNRNNPPVHVRMGDALALQGNEAAALSHYREAIRLRPEYVQAYERLASMLDTRGDGELAMSELRSALNTNPNYAPFKLALGRLALTVNKPDQAIQYYNEVLKNDASNPEALRGLSLAYTMQAEDMSSKQTVGGPDALVDAEEAINKALKANPDDISLNLAKVRIERLNGKPAEAMETLQRITQTEAHTDNEKIAKAEAYFALGQYQQSDEMFRSMLNQYQGDVPRQLVLADTLKMNGDLDMAAEVYQAIRAQHPESLKAERGLQRINIQRDDARKKYTLAEALNSRKGRQSAKDFYLETLSVYPRHADARESLGRIYEREKDYGQAIFQYEAYLNLKPEMQQKDRERWQRKIANLKEDLARQQAQQQMAAGKKATP